LFISLLNLKYKKVAGNVKEAIYMEITLIIGEDKEIKEISEDKTIKNLLEILDIPSETVVVKKNDFIVIDEEIIGDGDTIEIIKVIYGG
jgi:sulfur carrier protein